MYTQHTAICINLVSIYPSVYVVYCNRTAVCSSLYTGPKTLDLTCPYPYSAPDWGTSVTPSPRRLVFGPIRLVFPIFSRPVPQARTNPETLDSMSKDLSYMNSHSSKAQSLSCLSFKTKTRVFPLGHVTRRALRFMEPATETAAPFAYKSNIFGND